MATVQKITLSPSRDIPFNKLVLSQSNVRRLKAGVSIEELAEDIARRGLLQSLSVRPVLDEAGAETDMFEIPAGGRRYRALELLVKQKRLAKTAPVPCVVKNPTSGILAEDDSLAENIHRAPLHPLDQFRAFQALREKGQSEEEIAAAFFTSTTVVKQRLRLASVSPVLLDVYADDGISLEQLMAFTVAPEHERQEQVWKAVSGSYMQEPYHIRRMLTEKSVNANDRRAVFVGLEAYEAAGGTVLRDLFQADGGGWLEDVLLLDGLVAEKLKTEAETVAKEGWKWIDVTLDLQFGHARGLRKLEGEAVALTAEEQSAVEALTTEYNQLEAEYDGTEELPDEVAARFEELEDKIASFDNRPVIYQPSDIVRAGVFISLDRDGQLVVDRGYVRPDDEASEPGALQDGGAGVAETGQAGSAPAAALAPPTVISIGGQAPEAEDDDDDGVKPLPDRLVAELTAERTLAMRDRLAAAPAVAFQAVLYKFCLDVFSRYGSHGSAMEISIRDISFPAQAPGLKDSAVARSIAGRHKDWEERLPKERADLWHWLGALPADDQTALFAHCASFGVNALYEKADRYGGTASITQRIGEADRISGAVALDMVEAGWRPTVENYLGRVPKRRILEAVREGAGDRAAQLIDHLKKGEMAKEAERLLADSGWLPEPLRTGGQGDLAEAVEADATEADDDQALPAFLTGEDDDSPTADSIAAE